MEKRKSGRKNSATIEIHLGKLLKEKMNEYHFTQAEVASRITRPQSCINPLLKRPSMQAYLLWELSIAMEYDFFSDISQALFRKNANIKSAHAGDKILIASLQKELDTIKQERDYLKKMIDILAK